MKFVFRYSTRFLKSATAIFTEADLLELEVYLTLNPEAGDVIKGSSGLRKLRFASSGRGKRGGARVIYLRVVSPAVIHLLECYPKNRKTDLSPSEIETLKKESE